MLIEHRIDDVDEGFIAREQAMAPGEEVSFEPTLAQMFAQHLEHPAIGAEIDVHVFASAIHSLPDASKTASSRFDAVSSGPNSRKFRLSRLSFITSRRNVPRTRVDSASTPPGLGTATA
jgi:hypothetical protein